MKEDRRLTEKSPPYQANSTDLTKLVYEIAKSLVDHEKEVAVSKLTGENTTVIELRVAKSDIGKVIGKQGKTAKALRTILNGAAVKINQRTVLEILE